MLATFDTYGRGDLLGVQIYGKVRRTSLAREGKGVTCFLVFDKLPTLIEEPDLYRRAAEVDYLPNSASPNEAILSYPNGKVVLTTLNTDDGFRQEHPEIIADNEIYRQDF